VGYPGGARAPPTHIANICLEGSLKVAPFFVPINKAFLNPKLNFKNPKSTQNSKNHSADLKSLLKNLIPIRKLF
jgi:hypothetical protein